jgi:hypothetical protein
LEALQKKSVLNFMAERRYLTWDMKTYRCI